MRRLVATTRPPGLSRRGRLTIGALSIPCAVGRGGVTRAKREGDGASPAGELQVVGGFFRADRLPRPRCAIPMRPIRPVDGWGDEPGQPLYNRLLRLPTRCGHEEMWRDDSLYDIVLVLDYNLHPRRHGRGSAIFFHCARADLQPTAGCIALCLADMRRLMPRLARGVRLVIR